jgi:putative copper export protein/methionine-rich copper-binding protein CopC
MKVRILVTLLALFGGTAVVPHSALAHARLTKSAPAADARLSTLPTAMRLWYSEAPEIALTRVVLTDSAGHVVKVGVVERDESTLAVHVAIIGKLAAGRYKVTWKTAAADGHPSQGSFTFVVLAQAMRSLAPPAGSETTDSAAVAPHGTMVSSATPDHDDEPTAETPAYIAARTLTFVALVTVIGVVAFRSLVLERSAIHQADKSAMRVRAASLGVVAAVVLCASALTRLYLQAAMMSGPSDSTNSMIGMTLTQTRWGSAWILQAIAAVTALLGFLLARGDRRGAWMLAAIAALVLSVTSALAGHAIASATRASVAVVVDSLHVLGASGWLGSLLCLLFVGALPSAAAVARSENIRALVETFSPTALAFAAVVVVTGTLSAWLRVGSLPPLWASTYGKVLLLKIGLLSGVAGTGLYNWRRVRPVLGSEAATLRFVRSASLELGIGFFVLVVTAVLVAMPTPLDAG